MSTAWRRAAQAQLAPRAAVLTLSTALSIVPLMVVGFALFDRVPALRPMQAVIEQHLLATMLPADIASTVLAHLHRFARNAGSLTALGALLVLFAAVSMLHTIERSLDAMWSVRQPRALPWRLGRYLLMLGLGPLVLGSLLGGLVALFGPPAAWARGLPPSLWPWLQCGPLLLGTVVLTVLFRVLPHARVPWLQAFAGGVLGALALEAGKRVFAHWLIGGPTYRSLYGAAMALPVFLLWLYYSWFVTLAAALVTATLGPARAAARPRARPPARARA